MQNGRTKKTEVIQMADFVMTGQEVFGKYAKIAYGHASYPGYKQDYHIYKLIQRFRSNCYCDTPLTYQTEHNMYNHGEIVDVVNVIHCGIDESKVIRVALKDCEILPADNVRPVVPGEWKKNRDSINCSNCGFGMFPLGFYYMNGKYQWLDDCFLPNFCPYCGADMRPKEAGHADYHD